jgi:hypothetical protein
MTQFQWFRVITIRLKDKKTLGSGMKGMGSNRGEGPENGQAGQYVCM